MKHELITWNTLSFLDAANCGSLFLSAVHLSRIMTSVIWTRKMFSFHFMQRSIQRKDLLSLYLKLSSSGCSLQKRDIQY